MPKLKPETQIQRREHILDAARACFARTGFHRTTMHDICKESGVSPGAFYVYFRSKEALIEGLCERDRAEFAERFVSVSEAPDFLAGLQSLAAHYFVEESRERSLFVVEMSTEATRNPRIAEIVSRVDKYCCDQFAQLFRRLQSEGRIQPVVDIEIAVQAFNVVGDGLFYRRAMQQNFDANAVMPALLLMLKDLLRPVEASASLVGVEHKANPLDKIGSLDKTGPFKEVVR
ncbi:MAG: TetR/AcrR family transcriptional regulator [Hyphomicrobiaceae bacterium]|nr:TetR/AcrR family transcriptional regulator [Hyphomicrobiaceae bacterium]